MLASSGSHERVYSVYFVTLEFFFCHSSAGDMTGGVPESGFGGCVDTEPDGAVPGRVTPKRSLAFCAPGGPLTAGRKGKGRGRSRRKRRRTRRVD